MQTSDKQESMHIVICFLTLFTSNFVYGQQCCGLRKKTDTTTTSIPTSVLRNPSTEYLVDSRGVMDQGYNCLRLKEPIFRLQRPCGFGFIMKDECEIIKGITVNVSHRYPLHDNRISKYESPSKLSGLFTKHNSTTWVFEWPTAILKDKDFIYYQINITLTNETVHVLDDRIYVVRFNATNMFSNDSVHKNRVIHVG